MMASQKVRRTTSVLLVISVFLILGYVAARLGYLKDEIRCVFDNASEAEMLTLGLERAGRIQIKNKTETEELQARVISFEHSNGENSAAVVIFGTSPERQLARVRLTESDCVLYMEPLK